MVSIADRNVTSSFSSARPMRILLAEDDLQDSTLLREALDSSGSDRFEIDLVQDGESLFRRLVEPPGQANYCLAILDANLPRKSTEEVIRLIAAAPGGLQIPFVVLSSLFYKGQEDVFLGLGVRMALTKPLEWEEYVSLANQLARLAQPEHR